MTRRVTSGLDLTRWASRRRPERGLVQVPRRSIRALHRRPYLAAAGLVSAADCFARTARRSSCHFW